jgi:predicted alpha/beta-hydrolase family hydrolase
MAASRIVLAPGASGAIAQLRPHATALEARGLSVRLITLPKGAAERAVPVYRAAIADETGPIVIGGQSFGGRVASLLAVDAPPAAVVCFAYPLHAPGRHDAWDARTAHWPRITCPVLLLSGESDPMARIDLLRRAAERLPNGRLVTFPGVGHGVRPVLEVAMDTVRDFVTTNT